MRGHATSQVIVDLIKDLNSLKKPDSTMFQKKNDILPFEDATSVEFFSQKSDCSIILIGSHTKKRPHNLVIARMFNHQLLDMVEFGIENYKPLSSFKSAKCAIGGKHTFVFTGEIFEQKEEYKTVKSLFLDLYRGETIKEIDLQGLDHVISITATQEGRIFFKVFNIILKKSGSRLPRVELEEMGPSFEMIIRRIKVAAPEVMREALKIPRTLKPKKVKNISTDALGKKYGRVHVVKQDLNKMALKKMKGLRKRKSDSNESDSGEKKVKVDE